MEGKNQLLASIFVLTLLLLLRAIYMKESSESFRVAISPFSFGFLSFYKTLSVLFIISIVLPTAIMFPLFRDLYRRRGMKQRDVRKSLNVHIFYGYIALCLIYLIDLLYDYATSRDADPVVLRKSSEWHKYIIHFVMTPTLFLDAIYSIEIERILHLHGENAKMYSWVNYYAVQAFFASYLLYILLVVLFIDGQLSGLITSLTTLRPSHASKISTHVMYLANNIILCVFSSLIVGLIDQDVSITRVKTIFKVYTWMKLKRRNNESSVIEEESQPTAPLVRK